jgi:hypothetical protein
MAEIHVNISSNLRRFAVEIVIIIAAILFTAYRVWLYWKHQVYRIVPRIQVEELAAKLQTQYSERILLADVRSHEYHDPGAERIRGSIRLEPNNLSEEVKALPSTSGEPTVFTSDTRRYPKAPGDIVTAVEFHIDFHMIWKVADCFADPIVSKSP